MKMLERVGRYVNGAVAIGLGGKFGGIPAEVDMDPIPIGESTRIIQSLP